MKVKRQSAYNRDARLEWPAEVAESVRRLELLLEGSRARVHALERRECLLAEALMCSVELHSEREHRTDEMVDRYERALEALADDGFSGVPRRCECL